MTLRQECSELSDVIAAVYQDATHTDPWQHGLEAVRKYLHANVGCLQVTEAAPRHLYIFPSGPYVKPGSVTEWSRPEYFRYYELNIPARQTIIDNDYGSIGAKGDFSEVQKKYQVGRKMMTHVAKHDGMVYAFVAARSTSDAPFGEIEREQISLLAPHFENAIKLKQKLLQAQTAHNFLADALDSMCVGAIMVDADYRVSPLNATAEQLLNKKDALQLSRSGIHAVSPKDDRTLRKALASALQSDIPHHRRRYDALLVERKLGKRPLGVVVTSRVPYGMHLTSNANCAIIYTRDPEAQPYTDPVLFKQLFGLTNAEASVALALSNGVDLDDLVATQGITYNTIRAHLRAIFAKTGVSKRSELMWVLLNSSVPALNASLSPRNLPS